ncbi:MAG: transketolase [Planctomycetota bacterium]
MDHDPRLHDQIVNTIKGLTIDAVERAASGHPGLPMGMASAATVLWTRFLRFDPSDPEWIDRDRFVLSAGHGSMLLYSMLHLCCFDVSLDDLKGFRTLGSKTPGHPELGDTPGVETTTGPLGQGFATGVGMALAERYLASRYNTSDHTIIDHFTYAIVSDGDLMEGVASEAASLAGHQGLGKLIYLYDDNGVTIDGKTDLAFSENVPQRFESYGWHVQSIDGHDPRAVATAIEAAQKATDRPSLLCCKTVIGEGSPSLEGTSDIHSDPLGEEEIRKVKERMGWPVDQDFFVPDEVTSYFAERQSGWRENAAEWRKRFDAWRAKNDDKYAEWQTAFSKSLPSGLAAKLPDFKDAKPMATRKASGAVLQSLSESLPNLVGGSADLTGSNNTQIKAFEFQTAKSPGGGNVHFGVREHAMGAAMNGMALHGGVRPFGGTFLVFSDYMRPAVRLAALMHQPVTFVFTHDSIFLGQDGPTHQPIEHVASLRAIPNLNVIRPADPNEVCSAWISALERHDGPTALVLTRQSVPTLSEASRAGAARGAYVIHEPEGNGSLDGILIATGSEVSLCLEAAKAFAEDGRRVRVVSMPCWELFEAQTDEYREEVLPGSVRARLAVEAGTTLGWERWVGRDGGTLGIDRFGASAPYEDLQKEYGFTPENVRSQLESVWKRLAQDASIGA